MPQNAISVSGLRKKYGDFEAVRGIDFEVATGEVFGLLGPNGAGKTTTVEILEGIRQRTAGDVRVLDYDPDKQKTQLKDRIGVCLQATNLPDKIKVIEALELFGALYSRMLNPRDLLKRLQLSDKARRFLFHTCPAARSSASPLPSASSTTRRCCSSTSPPPASIRRSASKSTRCSQELRSEKRTILMTTHYIEEAERLCDRVAIVDAGKVIAIGTPRELQERSAGKSTIEIVCDRTLHGRAMPEWPESIQTKLSDDGRHLTVASKRPARTLVEIVKWVDAQCDRPRGRASRAPHSRRRLHRIDWKEAPRMNAWSDPHQNRRPAGLPAKGGDFLQLPDASRVLFHFCPGVSCRPGGVILQVVTMVTVIGILGNGLLGAGIRAAQDREANILRRFKVAPISPLPLLVASTVTGLVVYMPYVLLMLALAKWRYGMVMPAHTLAALVFIMLGVTGAALHRLDRGFCSQFHAGKRHSGADHLYGDAVPQRRHLSHRHVSQLAAGHRHSSSPPHGW